MLSLCHVMPPLKSFKELANDSGSCWQGSAGTGVTAGCRDSLVGLHACSSAASTCGLFLPCKSKKITKTFFRVRFLWQFFFFFVKVFLHVQPYLTSVTILISFWNEISSWIQSREKQKARGEISMLPGAWR